MNHPTIKEVFHVAGDAPDPTRGRGGGIAQGARGVAPGYDMTKGAAGHPMLLGWVNGQGVILEADVYALPGQPSYIHLICPMCLANGRTQMLTIREGVKAFSYDPRADVPPFPRWTRDQMLHAFPNGVGGLLSVEPFRCTWEEAADASRGFGFSVCTWQVAIDKNVVRPA